LQIYRPDGKPFLTFVELGQRLAQVEQKMNEATQRVDQLANYLRALGIDPDQI
jgi:hypothetical protein